MDNRNSSIELLRRALSRLLDHAVNTGYYRPDDPVLVIPAREALEKTQPSEVE